jgi:hypothetical protein
MLYMKSQIFFSLLIESLSLKKLHNNVFQLDLHVFLKRVFDTLNVKQNMTKEVFMFNVISVVCLCNSSTLSEIIYLYLDSSVSTMFLIRAG